VIVKFKLLILSLSTPPNIIIDSLTGSLTYNNVTPDIYITNVVNYNFLSDKYYGYNINSFTFTYNGLNPRLRRRIYCPCCKYKSKNIPVPFKCRCCVYKPISKCCKCNLCNKCYCRCDC
jgi:hypothetical protein